MLDDTRLQDRANITPAITFAGDAEARGGEGGGEFSNSGRRKRASSTKANYASLGVDSDDSDVDASVLRSEDEDSDDDDKPKRKKKSTGGGERRKYGKRRSSAHTFHMDQGPNSDSRYTITDMIPDWHEFDPEFDDAGAQVFEAILSRCRIDRSLPNKGIHTMEANTAATGERNAGEKEGGRGGGVTVVGVKITDGLEKAIAIASPEKNKFAGGGGDDCRDLNSVEQEPTWSDVVAERYEFVYQIKWKGRSHRHLEWLSAEEIEANSARAKQMFFRYLNKLQQSLDDGHDEADAYSEAWECERILSYRVNQVEIIDESQRKEDRGGDEHEDEKEAQEAVQAVGAEEGNGAASEDLNSDGGNLSSNSTLVEGVASATGQALFAVGQNVQVAAHERKGKMHQGGEGPVMKVAQAALVDDDDDDDDAPTQRFRFTYDVQYIVGGGAIHAVDEAHLQVKRAGGGLRKGEGTAEKKRKQALVAKQAAARRGEVFSKKKRSMRDDEVNRTMTPLQRCGHLLRRFLDDGSCEPFLEPVDLGGFPEYAEVIESPMDLGTIAAKLQLSGSKGYRTHEDFMRDMRLVWMNCKRFNSRESALWHSADALHKCSERLFRAWVLAFLPPPDATPSAAGSKPSLLFKYKLCGNRRRFGAAARPWENSCRVCENVDGSGDREKDVTLLCDHCDAQYHFGCVECDTMPEHAWLCPVCTAEPFRGQSAMVEDEAMEKSNDALVPRKTIKVIEFLVKWVGRSYGEASWEKKDDVADDAKVEEYCDAHGVHLAINQAGPVASVGGGSDDPYSPGSDEVVPFERMQNEFRSGFVHYVGSRQYNVPFKPPVLKPQPRVETEKWTDRIPMPLLQPHWTVCHNQPQPVAKEAQQILRKYEKADAETPHANTLAQVYAQIRLSHYLAHMAPVMAKTRAVIDYDRRQKKAKAEEERAGADPAPKVVSASFLLGSGAAKLSEAKASASSSSSSSSSLSSLTEVATNEEQTLPQSELKLATVYGLPPDDFMLAAGAPTMSMMLLERRKQRWSAARAREAAHVGSGSTSSSCSISIEVVVSDHNGDEEEGDEAEEERASVCASVLSELVQHTVRDTRPPGPGPPLRPGEYDVVVPRLASGFHMDIYESCGAVKIASFRNLEDQRFSPAEVVGINVNDSLVRINGQSVSHLRFGAIIDVLKAITESFVYLRLAQSRIEPEIRSEMYVINMNDRYSGEGTAAPGAPSSKYRGVFRRDNMWEVAITLHPDPSASKAHMKHNKNKSAPLSIYVVRGRTEDEEQAAFAYDHHVVRFMQEMGDYAWPHFDPPRRMTFQEIQMYTPKKVALNFGPRGFYEHMKIYDRRSKKLAQSDSEDESDEDSEDDGEEDSSSSLEIEDEEDDAETAEKAALDAAQALQAAQSSTSALQAMFKEHLPSLPSLSESSAVLLSSATSSTPPPPLPPPPPEDTAPATLGEEEKEKEEKKDDDNNETEDEQEDTDSKMEDNEDDDDKQEDEGKDDEGPVDNYALPKAAPRTAEEEAEDAEKQDIYNMSVHHFNSEPLTPQVSKSNKGSANESLFKGGALTGSHLDLDDVPKDIKPLPNDTQRGTSRFRGVTLIRSTRDADNDKWKAQITSGGIKFHLGMFPTEYEAGTMFARAYYKLFTMQECIPEQQQEQQEEIPVAPSTATADKAPGAVKLECDEARNGAESRKKAAAAQVAAPLSAKQSRRVTTEYVLGLSDSESDDELDLTPKEKAAREAKEKCAAMLNKMSAAAFVSGLNAGGYHYVKDDHYILRTEDKDESSSIPTPTSSSSLKTNSSPPLSSLSPLPPLPLSGAVEAAGGTADGRAVAVVSAAAAAAIPYPLKLVMPINEEQEGINAVPTLVIEDDWDAAGHLEKLLIAVEIAPIPPLNSAWKGTGLDPPYDGSNKESMDGTKGQTAGPGVLRQGQSVAQKDTDSGRVLKVWPSGTSAARQFKVPPKLILEACKNGTEVAGFKWEPFEKRKPEKKAKEKKAKEVTPAQAAASLAARAEAEVAEIMEEGKDSAHALNAEVDQSVMDETLGLDVDEKIKRQRRRDAGVFQYGESKDYKDGHKLREYQLNGLNWMLLCWHHKRSCILADEMGLGKTVQVVSFIEHLCMMDKLRGPYLVVVPLSTIGHWQREFQSWTDMTVCVYHDQGADLRALIRAFEWYFSVGNKNQSPYFRFEVLITTYDEVIKDVDQLAGVPWRGLVVDEAHRLKGINSKLLECLHQILPFGEQTHGFQHRLLLTGTPLQNNTKELWSLLNFIEPSKFPSLENFEETYSTITTNHQVRSLQQRLAPHLLRRVKEDVATDIPAKFETIIDVELTTIQKQYYRAIFEKNQAFLARAAKGAALPKLMNIQMELRKCCNHPHLIEGVEGRELESLQEELLKEGQNQANVQALSPSGRTYSTSQFRKAWLERCLLRSSGKMVLLDKLLPKLRREGHKVLIFSQMTRILNILEEFCDFRYFNHERLDGSITGNKRQEAIDRFNVDDDSFIFLLSTRAGGVGINLTAADTCIIFDSDWNPQNDVQAQARCHRIGQTKEVMVYRLITRNSFESEMFNRANRKLGLERAVLGTREFAGDEMDDSPDEVVATTTATDSSSLDPSKMSHSEVEKLLRQGAYSLLDEDDGTEAQAFCEGDIDDILNERSRVRKIEACRTESWLNKDGKKHPGCKSKAASIKVKKTTFTSESAGDNADVAVDDPEFWAKVMPDMKNAATLMDKLTHLTGLDQEEEGSAPPTEVAKLLKDIKEVAGEAMAREASGKRMADVERKELQKLLLHLSLAGDLIGFHEQAIAEKMRDDLEGKRRRTATLTDQAAAAGVASASSGDLRRDKAALLEMTKSTSLKPTKRSFRQGGDSDNYEYDVDEDDEIDEDEYSVHLEGGNGANKRKQKVEETGCGVSGKKKSKRSSGGGDGFGGGGGGQAGVARSNRKTKAMATKAMYVDENEDGETDEDDLLPNPEYVADEDKFEMECHSCGSWFNSVEQGITRDEAESFDSWSCRDCVMKKKKAILKAASKKRVRERKRAEKEAAGGGNNEHQVITKKSKKGETKFASNASSSSSSVQALPSVLTRAKCKDWPAWSEPAEKANLNRLCVGIVDALYECGPGDFEDIFGEPVPEGTPGYFELIPKPMDLGTMRAKATKGKYANLATFRKDLLLTIENCMTFNTDDSEFYRAAVELASFCHDAYIKASSR